MFSKRFIGFLVAPIATALSLLGPAPKAEGASMSGAFGLGGFDAIYVVSEYNGGTTFKFDVNSSVHRIDNIGVGFGTDQNDLSRVIGTLSVVGTKNVGLNQDGSSSGMTLNIGGVFVDQTLDLGFEQSPGFVSNFASLRLRIEPMEVLHTNFFYYERPPHSGLVEWVMKFNFEGRFPDPAMGLPFIGVPTPGAFGIAAAAGFIGLRRRRAA